MPPPLLFDLDRIDRSRICLTREQIYELLPHRHEFMLLDGASHVDLEAKRLVGFYEAREDSWWCKAHVPGRPLLPGVLMLEMAAHCSAVLAKLLRDDTKPFIGFGGLDSCKFREPVIPPAHLDILCQLTENRPRRVTALTQGVVNGAMAFEAKITGMTM
jgi:3-hydroxyacyl-[acyl-carrier-protein] dehydratase